MDGSVQVHQGKQITQRDPEQTSDTQETVYWNLIHESCAQRQARMKELRDFLRRNIHENVNLTELSKEVNIPKSTLATWRINIRKSLEKERRSAAGNSEYCSQPVGHYPPQLSGTFLLTGQVTAPASQVLVQARHLPDTWAQSCPVPQVSVLSTQHCQGASLATCHPRRLHRCLPQSRRRTRRLQRGHAEFLAPSDAHSRECARVAGSCLLLLPVHGLRCVGYYSAALRCCIGIEAAAWSAGRPF